MKLRNVCLLVGALGVGGCGAEMPTTPGPDLAQHSVLPSQAVAGSVTGNAHMSFFTQLPNGLGARKLSFSALRHGDGTTSGEWQIVVGATILHGDIDCVTILAGGARARISGVVENALFTSFQPGTAFAMEFVDEGQGSGGGGDATAGPLAFRNAPPEIGRAFCETGEAPSELELMRIERGNFQVRVH